MLSPAADSLKIGGVIPMDREVSLDLHNYGLVLRKNWWWIPVAVCVALTGNFFFTSYVLRDSRYTAEATVYGAASGSYEKSLQGAQAVTSYAELITSRRVAQEAAKILNDSSLDEDAILKMIRADAVDAQSATLTVHADASSPDTAVRVSNAVAQAFAAQINGITGLQNVQILDRANEAQKSFDPQKYRILAWVLAPAAGAALACAALAVLVLFSDKIYSREDASLGGELDVIGAVPKFRKI